MWRKSGVWLLSVKDFSRKSGRKSARVFRRKSIRHLIFAQRPVGLRQGEPTEESLSGWLCKLTGWLPKDLWGLLWDAGGREFQDYIKFILRCFKGFVEMHNEMFRERTEGSEREGSVWIRQEQAQEQRGKKGQKWPVECIWVSTLAWLSPLLGLIKPYFSLQRVAVLPGAGGETGVAVGQRSAQGWVPVPGGDRSRTGGTGGGHCVRHGCERCLCLCGCWYRHCFLPRWSSWPLDAIRNTHSASVLAGPANAQPLQPAKKTHHYHDPATSSSWQADFWKKMRTNKNCNWTKILWQH